MGRAEVKWVEWYGASPEEAAHLERCRQAMRLAGLRTDPETVIEIARNILTGPGAPSRLRKLADVWERREEVSETRRLVSNG